MSCVSTVKRPLVVRDTYLLCPAPVLEKEGTCVSRLSSRLRLADARLTLSPPRSATLHVSMNNGLSFVSSSVTIRAVACVSMQADGLSVTSPKVHEKSLVGAAEQGSGGHGQMK